VSISGSLTAAVCISYPWLRDPQFATDSNDWMYELKFDGYRALIIKDKQLIDLRSRKNKDLTGCIAE
jgi:ATP-dependent DNA ligase